VPDEEALILACSQREKGFEDVLAQHVLSHLANAGRRNGIQNYRVFPGVKREVTQLPPRRAEFLTSLSRDGRIYAL